MNIKWKHIVIGYVYINDNTFFRNILFSLIAFSVYKIKVLADFDNNILKLNTDIIKKVRNEVLNIIYPFKYMKNNTYNQYYMKIQEIIKNL